MPQILLEGLEAEADLTFQIKLSEQIDRFRRILNSGFYNQDYRNFNIIRDIYTRSM